MIGIDTNVLVRFFAQDDARQAGAARRLLNERLTRDEPGYVSAMCIVELAWVLTRSYDVQPAELAAIIDGLLNAPTLVLEHRNALRKALDDAGSTKADLADCFMGRVNEQAGCTETFTFDRRAARLPGFQLLT